MDEPLTICLHCGHEHPGSDPACPNCGHPAIDQRLGPADPVQLDFATGAPAPAGEKTAEPEEPERDEAGAPQSDTADPADQSTDDTEETAPVDIEGTPPADTHDIAAIAAIAAAPEPEEPEDPEEDEAIAAAVTAWPVSDLDWMDEPEEEPAAADPGPPDELAEPTSLVATAAQAATPAGPDAAPPEAVEPPPPLETAAGEGEGTGDAPDEPAEAAAGTEAAGEAADDESREPEPAPPAPAADDDGASEPVPPPPPAEPDQTRIATPPVAAPQPRSKRRGSRVVLVGFIVVAVIGGWIILLNQIAQDDSDTGNIAGADVIVSTTAPPATAATTAGATTAAPETGTGSTTAAPTTTPPPSTLPPVPDIEPIGDAIAVADLGLGAFALGDLDFGATDALGRLVATFGAPDAYAPMDGAFGLCDGTAGFTTTWGPLTTVYSGSIDAATFEGYRVSSGGGDHPAAALTTLSGLSAGDTVGELRSVYSRFIVSLDEDDGGIRFIVTRGTDGRTLLWGPVSSTDDDGTVFGIYSPDACDGGPAPTP